jgi:hypothetical protein
MQAKTLIVAGAMSITTMAMGGDVLLKTFDLFDHPSGAISPQAYGLRLDGFGGESTVTFSFEDDAGNSTVKLRVYDIGGGQTQIRMTGMMSGNSANGGTDFGMFALNIVYNVDDMSNGWDDNRTSDGDFIGDMMAMDATAESPLLNGETQNLYSLTDGRGSFRFLEDGHRVSGSNDTWVGRGWVSPDGQRGATNDFLFVGVEAVPLPPAAIGGLAMLGGLVAARRFRK